jgi:hypothetical protein
VRGISDEQYIAMLRKYTICGAAELAATLAAITQAKPDALNPDNPEQFKRFVQNGARGWRCRAR